MAELLENYDSFVQQHGLVTNKPVTLAAATALTAGGSTILSTTSGTTGPGVYVGSGVPTISAPQGSLYLRSDGSSVSTRLYVNSTGGTTWVAITTAS